MPHKHGNQHDFFTEKIALQLHFLEDLYFYKKTIYYKIPQFFQRKNQICVLFYTN